MQTKFFIWKKFSKIVLETIPNQPARTQKDSGYTLIEILIVVLMVGILAAIAAPGWIAFLNRQNVNKANDAVLAAIQDAQRQAKKTKLSYSVSFKNDYNNKPLIAVHSASSAPDNFWQPVGNGLNIKSGQILLGTNLANTNIASSATSYNLSTAQSITFDYMGSLPNANFGTATAPATPPGLKIVVTTPKPGTTIPIGVKRCVIVQTLLGGMQTAKDASCN